MTHSGQPAVVTSFTNFPLKPDTVWVVTESVKDYRYVLTSIGFFSPKGPVVYWEDLIWNTCEECSEGSCLWRDAVRLNWGEILMFREPNMGGEWKKSGSFGRNVNSLLFNKYWPAFCLSVSLLLCFSVSLSLSLVISLSHCLSPYQ